MRKRRYGATNVKQAQEEKIAAPVPGRRPAFGADGAEDDFFGVPMKTDRRPLFADGRSRQQP